MKKRFTILMAAMMLLVTFAIPMGVWGQTTHTIGWGTASGDAGTYTNFTATSGSVANILSFSTAQNSANNAPAYNASNKELRLYNASNGNGCSITITPASDLTITQIVITATSGYTSDVKYSVDGGTATAATWNNNTCTISGIEASTSLMVQNVKTSTQQLRIKTIAVTYAVDGPVTYTVTYDCNGGTSGCPENLTGLSANTSITLANAPTKEHFNFEGWSDGTNTYDAGDPYTVNSHVTFTAQWESDGMYGEGSICFSNQTSCTAINSQSVTGEDNLGNTWTITTVGTSSFTSNSGYYQVGSGNSPATSITFTTTFDEEVNVTDFSAMFGGFNATRASVVLKVDNTQVGSGTLNGAADVTVSSSSAQIGTTLTVIVTPTAGGVKCYNISYAYETIDNPAVATTTTINVPANFNTDIYQGTTAGTLTATVSAEGTPISGATVTWSSSNTDVATIDASTGVVTLVAVGTTTITASYAGVEDQYRPSSATYSLEVTDSTPVLDATFIFNTDEGLAELNITKPNAGAGTDLDANHDYVIGNVTMNVTHGSGTNTRIWNTNGNTTLRVYSGGSLTFSVPAGYAVTKVTFDGSANFNEFSNGVWTASGEPVSTITFTNKSSGSTIRTITVEYEENASVVAAPTLPTSVNFLSQMTVEITNNASGATVYYTTDGSDPKTSNTRIEYTQAFTLNATTTVKAVAVKDSNYSQVVEATYTLVDVLNTMQAVYDAAGDDETNVFVNFNNYVVSGVSTNGKNVFVTDNNGKGFVIYYTTDMSSTFEAGDILSGTAVACNLKKYNGFAELLNVDASNLTITTGGTVSTSNIAMADLAGVNTGALVSYQNLTCSVDDGNTPKYYLTDGTTTLQVYNSLYAFEALEDGATYRITGIYQQFNNTKEILPRNAADIVEVVSIDLTVSGYGDSEFGGYHLIASPIMETVLPTEVTNMIDETAYDLFRFNQDATAEWQHYRGHTDGFVIEPGKAYLYAHPTDVTLTFNGTAYNGDGTFALTQSTTNTSNGGKMNAIGNPFNTTTNIGSIPFYKMNADGTALEAVVGGTIGALEGIVVNYDANNPTVTFSTSKSRDVIELLTLNLQEQDNVIDNVIVRFDGGDQLLKYQIFDSSKIYVTVDGEDYAVVRGENQGTLPVNFMALSNGTYTISMDFENMTFSYLHLIDNLTGEDIDMLTTTSYSFDATTEDDANRFTLVYSKDGEGTTETLTFYDGDTSSGYVPVYGFYADAYQKVEFIMPAEDLYALTGATINKMTWYLTTPAEAAWGGNFKIYLMETEETTPADYADLTNATLVYDGPLDGTGETLEINFATGFLYEGDNLLVAVHQTETGTYKSATFAGSAVAGAALQGYSYNNLDQVNQAVRDFLPKTTFEFTPGSGAIYYKPKQLQASEIGITSAVLTWEAGDDETSWGVEYKKVTEDTWTDAGTVDQLTITLDNLEAGTEYEAHVKSIYTDGESGWTTIAFATEACEETDKGEVAYTLTDTYGDGWNNNKLRIFLSGTDIMIAELTLTTGSELEGVVKLCYDTDYDLVWVAGNYAYETGFVLTAPDGTIIYEYHGTGSSSGGTTPTPGVLTTFQIHNGFTKTIEAYTDNSGYYLIASPVGNVLASEVTNMVDGNYDLYMFDQTGDDEGKQWLNYKASAFSYLEVGMGYLYASESDVTLTFSGTPISSDDDYAVEVNFDASSDFPGLNLLGNPFAEEAYLVNAEGNGLAYHRLNPANNTYVTVDDNSAIPMMEGVFYEAGENDVVVYFSATAPATSKSNLNITVSQGRGMVDNAIVRFGEGNTLRKISLRDNSTKIYIPQNGNEYALVNANDCGEMPVNFKAESNGTYTMSFSNQNVEFGYLHLIDNLTGADVDLLANPSYSFEAKVSDYASRFKLVFATGNDDSSSDFAFVSNDEIIVNGEGMLQVIDMTGRIISTSQVNGMSSIKLNAAAGVYVLRLNDKTQKIVIK